MTTGFTIILKRIGKGLGDIAAMVRAIELLKLKYATARIIVITRYPDLIKGHPAIDEVIESDKDFSFPPNDVFIDLDIIPLDRSKARHQIFCERVSEELAKKDMEGIEWDGRPQNLWVSRDGYLWAKQLIGNAARGKTPIGVFWKSEEKWRTWGGMKSLVKLLVESNCAVFCFDAKEKFKTIDGVNQIVGYPLNRVNALVSNMRLVVTPDSGGLHIAGGLGVPTVALFGATDPLTIAGMYDNLHYIPVSCSKHPCWRSYCITVSCLRRIKPIDVYDKVEELITGKPVKRRGKYRRKTIAIHKLDGMGGTLTLSDHAMKYKKEYPDHKIVLVIRGFSQLFDNNPYVDDIIEVGNISWNDSLDNHKRKYTSLIDIRFAIARIYGKGAVGQKFLPYQRLYDSFPIGQQELDSHGLHHVQLANKVLGLPYDTIDVKVFFNLPPNMVSGDYVVVNNGVDVIYKGKKQTKSWTYWKELVELLDIKCVQVGTEHDSPIPGAIDLRGKTSIKALGAVLRGAKAIIVGEGGIAHHAYALGCSNVIVIRGPTASKLLEYPGQIQVDPYPCKNCFFSTPEWFFKCPMNMVEPVCMASISAERVVRVYENLVESKRFPEMLMDDSMELSESSVN